MHQALQWAFRKCSRQHKEINCFSDQPAVRFCNLPTSKQLTLEYYGKVDISNVHTILFKTSSQATEPSDNCLKKKGEAQGQLTVIFKLKCTPQPEHLAETIYLHHRATSSTSELLP